MIGAGQLDRPVRLMARATSLDDFGQPVDTWALVAVVMARIRPVYGRELAAGGASMSQTSYEFLIGARSIDSRHRFEVGGDVYDISAVMDASAANRRQLRILCEKGTSDG